MASNRELKITIVGDSSRLRQAANQAKADLEAAAAAAKKIDEAAAKAEKATEAEAAAAKSTKKELEGAADAAKRTAAEAQGAAKATDKLRQSAKQTKTEAEGVGDAAKKTKDGFDGAATGSEKLRGSIVRIVASSVGFAALAGAIRGVTDELAKMNERTVTAGERMASARQRIRSLAGIKGTGFSTDQDVKQVFDIQRQTGFTNEEAVRFMEGMLNEGISSIGNKITQPEYDKYQLQAGKLISAKALGPAQDDASNLAGSMLRWKDYSKSGADAAIGDFKSVFDVLNLGSGSMPVLIREMTQASGYLNENEKRGYFKDPAKLAVATSMGAQFAPGQAGTYIRQAIRALTKFEGPQGETLQEARISPNDDFFESMGKMKTYLEKNAVAKGIRPSFYLQTHGFTEQESREAIVNFMTAMDSSAYKAQRAMVDKPRSGALAAAEIKAFQQSLEGQSLIAKQVAETRELEASMRTEAALPIMDAAKGAVNLERIQERSTWQPLKRGAYDKLVDNPLANMFFGRALPTSEELDVRAKQAELLDQQARQMGVEPPGLGRFNSTFFNPVEWTQQLGDAASKLKDAAAIMSKTAPTAPPTVGTPVPPPIGAAPAITGPVQ